MKYLWSALCMGVQQRKDISQLPCSAAARLPPVRSPWVYLLYF